MKSSFSFFYLKISRLLLFFYLLYHFFVWTVIQLLKFRFQTTLNNFPVKIVTPVSVYLLQIFLFPQLTLSYLRYYLLSLVLISVELTVLFYISHWQSIYGPAGIFSDSRNFRSYCYSDGLVLTMVELIFVTSIIQILM